MTTPSIEFPDNHKSVPYQAQSSTDGCDDVLSLVATSDDTVLTQIFFFGDGSEETARREVTFCLLAAAPALLELAKNVILTRSRSGKISDDLHQEAMSIMIRLHNPEGDDQ